MGIFNDIVSGVFGGSPNTTAGYEQAQQNLQPYVEGGQQSLSQLQNYLGGVGSNLSQYGNPADWMWSQINQSPQDFYQTLMSGYEQSPQYQQQMENMQKAIANAGAASGMMGSGSFYDDWQRNAQNIMAQDQDRWLQNMLGVNTRQGDYLGDYRNVEQNYMNQLNALSGMGANAAATSGQYAVGQGQAQDASNPWGNIANLGASLYLGGVPMYGGQGTYFT